MSLLTKKKTTIVIPQRHPPDLYAETDKNFFLLFEFSRQDLVDQESIPPAIFPPPKQLLAARVEQQQHPRLIDGNTMGDN